MYVIVIGILEALIGAAADRDEDAQAAIFKSLLDIGRKKHTLVLGTTHAFLIKHSKVLIVFYYLVINTLFVVVKKPQNSVVKTYGEHKQKSY